MLVVVEQLYPEHSSQKYGGNYVRVVAAFSILRVTCAQDVAIDIHADTQSIVDKAKPYQKAGIVLLSIRILFRPFYAPKVAEVNHDDQLTKSHTLPAIL